MKVSILTEALNETGCGHLTRCQSLSQAFQEKNIYPTLYINGDRSCLSVLNEKENFKIIDWLNRPAQLLSEISNSDLLIIDSYLAGKEYYEKFSEQCSLSVFIDDNFRIEYPEGIILNSTVGAELISSYRKTDLLLGTKYTPLRKEFWNVPSRKINQNISSLLITFGGQDNKNLTPSVLASVQESFPQINISVVIGQGFSNSANIDKLKNSRTTLIYSPNASEMYNLMIESDIAISAAGQTLYELAAAGTPSIIIAVAENQKQSMVEWKKKGFLLDTIYFGDVNHIKKIHDQLYKLQSITLRKKLSRIGRINVDGNGSQRVIKKLINFYCDKYKFYFRSAVESDSKKIFDLSNDPIVRAQSINQSSIPPLEHQEWFIEKINDDNCLFLLALDKQEKLIGQVRFQIEYESAIVSISISNEFRGKGFSKDILIKACNKLFANHRSVKKIIAYILPDNSPSIKGFKSAGFILSGEIEISGKAFLKYLLTKT